MTPAQEKLAESLVGVGDPDTRAIMAHVFATSSEADHPGYRLALLALGARDDTLDPVHKEWVEREYQKDIARRATMRKESGDGE
jgi:hypothetical protein